MKTISYDDYLRLCGLLKIAEDYRAMLHVIERSACALTHETPGGGGHTGDTVWGGYARSARDLLGLLDIAVEPPAAQTTTPEDAARQAEGAMRTARQLNALFGGEETTDA